MDRDLNRAKGDQMNSGRDRHRDSGPPPIKPLNLSGLANPPETSSRGSLRSRISEKEPSPLSFRGADARNEEEREQQRKRTLAGMLNISYHLSNTDLIIDRDVDMSDGGAGLNGDPSAQPPKRPRTAPVRRNFNNQGTGPHAIARKLLPIDPSAGDKNQRRSE